MKRHFNLCVVGVISFQSTDLFVMASNSFQQAKSIFEVVNNVHTEVRLLILNDDGL